jgi:hypothetical protein
LKNHLREKAPKTVNNVLTVLNTLLKQAVEWNVIDRHPCTIRLLPIHKGSARFHDFEAFERLVDAAKSTDARAYLIVLLGGEAGLRCGEMDGAGMDRYRSGHTPVVRAAVGLEGTGDRPEERPIAIRAADDSVSRSVA